MLIGKFIGKIKAKDTHSNQYGSDGAVKPQSFEERKDIDSSRKVIDNFRKSIIGSQYAPKQDRYKDKKEQEEKYRKYRGALSGQRHDISSGVSRNEAVSDSNPARNDSSNRQRTFQEPPSRGYNPYK
ncbi:hypothetical protein H6796_02420 [Candidatus Nomurabacteria bacterium]|nr:hypothetical protein [Candidatus Nomurabacteria bacterium]